MANTKYPESQMMSHAYDPCQASGAVKTPLYQTSTFVFNTAEEGKAYFELAYGLRKPEEGEQMGYIYSRISNPNLDILEKRLTLWDGADDGAVFESGMAAISTALLEFLKPGDLLLYSSPSYGGTDHFIKHNLAEMGIHSLGVHAGMSKAEIIGLIINSGKSNRLACIYLETPANPTNDIFDIALFKEIANEFATSGESAKLLVDNTYMGPLWSSPLEHGADLVLYSATKYIGGHSDLTAGAVLGSSELIHRIKVLRTFLGNRVSPHTAWLLLRSLETLKIRMDQQMRNAQVVADYLSKHPLVEKVHYLGHLSENDPSYDIFKKQYSSPGAMISFEIKGGEKEAFQFLNGLGLIKLAVSLGSTESLAQHPASMTHAGVDPEEKLQMGIYENLVRISIGIEHHEDLISDIDHAFGQVVLSSENAYSLEA